ncbi:MAG: hypothetical protein ACXWC0_14775 [Burkholderiales bacterium]
MINNRMKSRANLSTRIDVGLRQFAHHLSNNASLEDGALTTRIVGEFSAGKTRLLRELLGDLVPDELAPISSREVQTRLPLELTYGPAARLSVVERAVDAVSGKEIDVLDRFPVREEIEARGYRPEIHRLRLSLPIERFILREGDGYHDDKRPRRLFLIDMPGWNSGEDDIAEQEPDLVLEAELSLSLVYVTSSTRLDSAANRKRLRSFLTAMSEAEFLTGPRLMVVLTHCTADEQAKLSERARGLIDSIWEEVGQYAGELSLEILCAEFNDMPELERQGFRERFWTYLLEPLSQQEKPVHPWIAQIRSWPQEWDIRPRLQNTYSLLNALRQVADRVQRNGHFLHGMNMHRLMGLSDDEIRSKVHQAWQSQIKSTDFDEMQAALAAIRLDAAHPLSDWWRDVWLDQAKLISHAVHIFLVQAQRALDSVTAATPDLEAHLQRQLNKPYARMQAALTSSFARLIDAVQPLVHDEPEKALATLLALSAMQGRYEKQYVTHLQSLRDEVFE